MQGYLNAGFGEMLGEDWLNKIYNIGFAGIRTDIFSHSRKAIVDELGTFKKLSPIFLFGGGNMEGWTPDTFKEQVALVSKQITDEGYFTDIPVYFEIGNEPDIAVSYWKRNPSRLNETYWDCYQIAKSINNKIEVITGGISNLNDHGLDWLETYMADPIPAGGIVGFHRYSNGPNMRDPHNGFESRADEFNRLQASTGAHKLFCTETGHSQGPHGVNRGFPLCWMKRHVYLTQEEQALAATNEWAFYKVRKVIGMVWYQHRDGQDHKDILSNYGIYDINSQEKAAVNAFRRIFN